MVCEVSGLRSSMSLLVLRDLIEVCMIGHCKYVYCCFVTGASIAASDHFVPWMKSGMCCMQKKVVHICSAVPCDGYALSR